MSTKLILRGFEDGDDGVAGAGQRARGCLVAREGGGNGLPVGLAGGQRKEGVEQAPGAAAISQGAARWPAATVLSHMAYVNSLCASLRVSEAVAIIENMRRKGAPRGEARMGGWGDRILFGNGLSARRPRARWPAYSFSFSFFGFLAVAYRF